MLSPLTIITYNEKIDEMFPLLIIGIIINYAAVCFIGISAGLLTGILKLHPFRTSMADCCLLLSHSHMSTISLFNGINSLLLPPFCIDVYKPIGICLWKVKVSSMYLLEHRGTSVVA